MIEIIIDILRHQVGKANAMTARDIAIALAKRGVSTTERSVRDAIAQAETDGTMPLLLGGRGGEGFYVAQTYDELAERARSLWEQITALSRRLHAFVKAAHKLGIHLPIEAERDIETSRRRDTFGLGSGARRRKEAA